MDVKKGVKKDGGRIGCSLKPDLTCLSLTLSTNNFCCTVIMFKWK